MHNLSGPETLHPAHFGALYNRTLALILGSTAPNARATKWAVRVQRPAARTTHPRDHIFHMAEGQRYSCSKGERWAVDMSFRLRRSIRRQRRNMSLTLPCTPMEYMHNQPIF